MKQVIHGLFLTLLLVILLSSQSPPPSHAQSSIELEDAQASVDFGEQIVFSATITPAFAARDVSIVIFEEGQGTTHVEQVIPGEDGHIEFRFDPLQNALRPFAIVQWHYRFTFQDGSTAQSETFSVRYVDDRFDWQTLEVEGLRVSWYGADASFGEAALEAARAGLESIGNWFPLTLTPPIEVYVYTRPDDLRLTLAPGGADWIAGHADPALGVVMVAIESGAEQGTLMEQRIPHELMHILLHRHVGTGYQNIPVWLREGMATGVERYPSPDRERVLADALAGDRLIRLQELCASFPAGAAQAFLAYAQSRSFTQYLQDMYGSTRLLDLATTYADGVDCEVGTERVFGLPLSRLEADWRSSIQRQDSFLSMTSDMAPYLVLLCLVLAIPLIGIATTFRKKGNRNGPEAYVRKR